MPGSASQVSRCSLFKPFLTTQQPEHDRATQGGGEGTLQAPPTAAAAAGCTTRSAAVNPLDCLAAGMADDVGLPKSSLQKSIKDMLPADMRIAGDASDLLVQCCNQFVHLVSTQANVVSEREKRSTISPEHVVRALEELEFGGLYVEAVRAGELAAAPAGSRSGGPPGGWGRGGCARQGPHVRLQHCWYCVDVGVHSTATNQNGVGCPPVQPACLPLPLPAGLKQQYSSDGCVQPALPATAALAFVSTRRFCLPARCAVWDEWKVDNKEHQHQKLASKKSGLGQSGLTQQQLIELQHKLFEEARAATLSGPLPSLVEASPAPGAAAGTPAAAGGDEQAGAAPAAAAVAQQLASQQEQQPGHEPQEGQTGHAAAVEGSSGAAAAAVVQEGAAEEDEAAEDDPLDDVGDVDSELA